MDAINTQGEVLMPSKVVDSQVVKEPKGHNDSFYSETPSKKSGIVTTSVNHVI